jgi:cytoskeleton protein RodZ
MDALGEDLKRAREAAGLSLRDMETRTKISVSALEALERNDFSRLPGGIFGRSFVRAYAMEVGVDPDETVTRFVALLEHNEREAAARRAARQPEITQDDREFLARQRRALIVVRVAAVLLAVGLVALITWRVRIMLTAPVDPVPPSAARPDLAVMTLELDLIADCWIEMSIDGAKPVARLFRAGEQQSVEATREVLLDVGNAGALRMTIDGRPARSLGGTGARVRTRITRDNLDTFLADASN